MFGLIDVHALPRVLLPVVVVSAVAVVTDLSRGKIYNWLTGPALLLGLIVSAYWDGWPALASSLGGAAAGLLLYGAMFWFGILGGGDVKLLMALGAWGGTRFAIETGLLGILLGGVFATVALAFRGRLPSLMRRMYRFFLTVWVKELELEAPQLDRRHRLAFALPIAVAAVWACLGQPFEQLGMHLW